MTAPAPRQGATGDTGQARLVAIVIAAAGGLWVLAQFAVDPRSPWAALFDLMALAAFIWAFAVTWRIWRRARRQEK